MNAGTVERILEQLDRMGIDRSLVRIRVKPETVTYPGGEYQNNQLSVIRTADGVEIYLSLDLSERPGGDYIAASDIARFLGMSTIIQYTEVAEGNGE